MPRSLHPSALEAVRTLAAEAIRHRRPRRVTRVRIYALALAPAGPSLTVLGAVLDGLHRLGTS
ncbi:hypothetical protein ACFWTE_05450 [Nocardiopsis sp. NPDC058631]|uniref:hypothetical protein n=1 Tax=Nocardiopsis sp. NPDC058631 TaxID=3346566 RepID=UPI0036680AF3